MAATNVSVFGAKVAVEAKRWPRCPRRYHTTTPTGWSCGTYTFRYMRSMHSLSSTTWCRSTWLTLCGRVIVGSGRPRGLRTPSRFERQYRWASPSLARPEPPYTLEPSRQPGRSSSKRGLGQRPSKTRSGDALVGLTRVAAAMESRAMLDAPLGAGALVQVDRAI